MRSRCLSIVAAVLILGLLVLPRLQTDARGDPPAGLSIASLGSAAMATSSGEELQLDELTLNPGVSVTMGHHAGPIVVAVESGELTTSVADSNATVSRNGEAGERTEPGRKYILEPGDTIIFDAGTTGQVLQNNGIPILVLAATVLVQNGQPDFAFEPARFALFPSGPCISCH